MIKMLCPEPRSFSEKGLNYARSFTELTATNLSKKELHEIANNYDAILIRFNTEIDSCFFKDKTKLKAIISPTTGLDHIDLETARKKGVEVFHLRGEKKFLQTMSGTAELTVGLMISIARSIPQSFNSVKEGIWDTGSFRGNELSGKVLGIIGCGRLGSKVARVAVAMNMDVVAYDPFTSKFPSGVVRKNNQQEVLSTSDILSLHVPLNADTTHLIGHAEFNQMKSRVVIINSSRGAIIETSAFLENLENGKISGAAIDVIEDEHLFLGKKHRLVKYASENNNLIITPHIGGATFESVENADLFVLKKYEKALRKI